MTTRMVEAPAPKNLRQRLARTVWKSHPGRPGQLFSLLRESQWWSRERLVEYQLARLRELVTTASANRFYADRFQQAGMNAEGIRSMDDVRRLPVLERADLVRLGIEGIKVPGAWGMRAASSGSTGKRVEFLWPLSHMQWLDSAEARARSWLGCWVGERSLEVRCRPVGVPQAIFATLLNAEALHAPTLGDGRVVEGLLRSLEGKDPPALVWGVSNALYLVGLALLEHGRTLPARACWSGGNHLHPHYRKVMEAAFQCEVYERYATMETGLIAHQCPEERALHVPMEGILAEIVREDGSEAGPGETGEVLVTVLRNTATPLIRYRIGDRAVVPETQECACGRGLMKFGTVVGRARDFLVTREKELIAPRQAIRAVFEEAAPAFGTMLDFQVIQDEQRNLRIMVMQRDSGPVEAERTRIAELFEKWVNPPVAPVVEPVDKIALTTGGKVRTLISNAVT